MPPSSDDALLARLNALKPSRAPSLSTGTPPPQPGDAVVAAFIPPSTAAEQSDPVLDLAARFKRLNSSSSPRGGKRSTSPLPAAPSVKEDGGEGFGEEGKSLDELLRELGGEEWDMGKMEERDVGRLVREVRSVIPEVEAERRLGRESKKGVKEGEGLGRNEEGKEQDEDEGQDEQDADEYIAQILAELDIEEKYGKGDNEDRHNPSHNEKPEHDDAKTATPHGHPKPEGQNPSNDNPSDEDPFSLPAPPNTHPASPHQNTSDDDFNNIFNARLAALSSPSTPSNPSTLPSAPKFSPTKKPAVRVSKTEQFADEEIDSWCIICYADATVRCLGCDGDLYCQGCWNEGHRGESAGFEERGHRAMQFVRGKKEKEGRKKVSLGAG
ncbi:hypothetical protein K490DRAFT_67510 [Saccharata proteae CBS 121410]|uniref:Uncharacterized protein n=1 Tax=Saccharata proteae CBS 121410 TaxID=1314787 RepID=A0A9P4HRL2_9PEZI|nr:hypothetical protein K490DRAFT_67510 [Saccharata proteae CBS 121410]